MTGQRQPCGYSSSRGSSERVPCSSHTGCSNRNNPCYPFLRNTAGTGTGVKLSNQDLLNLCEIYKAKALEEHDLFRKWQARAIEAEQRLAIYEGDPND